MAWPRFEDKCGVSAVAKKAPCAPTIYASQRAMAATETIPDAATQTSPRVLTAFIAVAILAGPINSFVSDPSGLGAQSFGPQGAAVASGIAGVVLLGVAALRRERLPRCGEWGALLLLFAPQWIAGLLAAPGIRLPSALHTTPWGVAFLVSLAAPLWLSLLSASQLVHEQAPRAVAGASIVGIGAVCLATPGGAYAVTLKEIPFAVLEMVVGVLAVWSWTYARPRLATTSTAAAAGCFLLLNAVGAVAAMPLTSGTQYYAPDWHAAFLPLLCIALLQAALWWLWFWLLRRMTLAAFGMRPLAAWAASIVPGFVLVSLTSWRIDAAFVIAVAALVIALRARPGDEQPLALGLADS